MENIDEEIKNEVNDVAGSFDRGVDYNDIKEKLINRLDELYKIHLDKPTDVCIKRIVYTVIAMIQLRCGSRISEAVKAFILFIKNGNDKRVSVKVSKTGAIKVKKDGTRFRTKVKAREMMWPTWINKKIYGIIKKNDIVKKMIEAGTLKKRTLDYLLINFNCNTHSLRYAFINYMLYVEKRPMADIAKYIGHANVAQMVTYTQTKNSNQIFDLDI